MQLWEDCWPGCTGTGGRTVAHARLQSVGMSSEQLPSGQHTDLTSPECAFNCETLLQKKDCSRRRFPPPFASPLPGPCELQPAPKHNVIEVWSCCLAADAG